MTLQNHAVSTILCIIAAYGLLGCNYTVLPIGGCYATKPHGPARAKVWTKGDVPYIAFRLDSIWLEGRPAHAATHKEIWDVFRTDGVRDGLVANGTTMGIFRLTFGARVRAIDSTAHYALPWIGNGSAYSVKCASVR
ncbi:MAG: hypothetical protein JWM95_1498 [Gemmatimonadetes bacterium]|nr:hypothetical protein [Gemmatimonadota bacterium]